MSQYCGIIRQPDEMNDSLLKMDSIKNKAEILFSKYRNNREVIEFYNLAIIADLIITGALKRRKSVGAHYVTNDFEFQAISTQTNRSTQSGIAGLVSVF